MEYYSATKKSIIIPFTETWIDQEIIILSEVIYIEKGKYHTILLICGIYMDIYKNRNRLKIYTNGHVNKIEIESKT